MKAVFVVYNQALSEQVHETIQHAGIQGYTRWRNVEGAGSETGEPHLGSHIWPAINAATMLIVTDQEAKVLMERLALLNSQTPQQGLRAFSWEISETI